MKTPIDSTVIDAIKSIVEGTKADVTYNISKEEHYPMFDHKTFWERWFGLQWRHEAFRKTIIYITIIEK
jgi:hypothetical protein